MRRFLFDREFLDIENTLIHKYDVVIIGSGIAGVYTALEIPECYDVAIITKEKMDNNNSMLAQGGIAVALDKEDSPLLHFKDTIYAGAGLCNEESVWVLVNEAARNIENLCRFGVNFDKKSEIELALTREAAHSRNRIIHAGDTTGKEVCDTLVSVAANKKNISFHEKIFAIELITSGNPGDAENLGDVENKVNTKKAGDTKNEGDKKDPGDAENTVNTVNPGDAVNTGKQERCIGIVAYDENRNMPVIYLSDIIICATGGYGQIYSSTTNPEVATGDGICLSYRAGAQLMDLEFVQFHPTVLYHPENCNFLISEAVRGEGAVLRNMRGERFMQKYHTLGELAPRDVVSRSIFSEMQESGSQHVYLDITFLEKSYLENRFPNIFKTCLGYGIDMSKDYIPVAPAQHYSMGGICTDVFGRTQIEGFYACGEAACTGIHGANRLASNSLLEGLVFGKKISEEVSAILEKRNAEPNEENTDLLKSLFTVSYNQKTLENCYYLAGKLSGSKQEDACSVINDNNVCNAKTEGTHDIEGTHNTGETFNTEGTHNIDGILNIEDIFNPCNNEGLTNAQAFITDKEIDRIRYEIRSIMTEKVGIVRDKNGLEEALERLVQFYNVACRIKNTTIKHFELQNIILLSLLVIKSALCREESRGAHYRSDFVKTDDLNWKRNIVWRAR